MPLKASVISRVLTCMITAGVIPNGSTYLSHHLRKNHYLTEGEKEVRGDWIGEGVTAVCLTGMVIDERETLRQNGQPSTGEPLTARDQSNWVVFFDVQLSAPKDVSVLEIVDAMFGLGPHAKRCGLFNPCEWKRGLPGLTSQSCLLVLTKPSAEIYGEICLPTL